MDDVGFLDLAHATVEWVDERYGSFAGWTVAALMVIFPFVVLAGIIAVVISFR